MRHKISITFGEDTLSKVSDELRSKTYRSKSHFFEVAAENLINGGAEQ